MISMAEDSAQASSLEEGEKKEVHQVIGRQWMVGSQLPRNL